MNILVCIKPDVTGEEIGPFERLALEAGLSLKEACLASGVTARVDVVAAGPASWQDCLVRALGTGADRGIHILTPADSDSPVPNPMPASAVAALLAQTLSPMDYDLILAGVMSQDLMAGQTGPMLAQLLEVPCATAAFELALSETPDSLLVNREMEGGLQERLRVPLPALVTVQSGFYTPRYPVLSHMLKAREKPVQQFTIPCLPQVPETVNVPVAPEQTRAGTVASGSLGEQVEAFKCFLRERGLE